TKCAQITTPAQYETEPWAAYLKNHLPLIHGKPIANIEKAQVKQKRSYNKGKRTKHDYKAGDLIARRNLLKTGFPKEPWTGPWRILERNNEDGSSFKIVKLDDKHQHTTTANIKHMRPWNEENQRNHLISFKRGMM
ncbi:hypothetical protein A0J61_11213, partial [Choanephora cucurbitarum]